MAEKVTELFKDNIYPDLTFEQILELYKVEGRELYNPFVYGGTLDGLTIKNLQRGSDLAIQDWQLDCTFSATDSDTVAWGAGTLTLADGRTFSIGAGNTGNMAAFTYIYFDREVSETALQASTTASDAIGKQKILIAIAQNVSDATKYAKFNVLGGKALMGGSWWTADNIIVANLAAISADIGAITAGTITLDASGFIKGGQTGYNLGTGFFLGYDSGAYKLSLGVSTGNYLTWDGSILKVVGSLVPVVFPTLTILSSADTARDTTSTTYVKIKEITIQFPGEINVYFEHKDGSDCTFYGQVCRNDVAVGAEVVGAGGNTNYVASSQNISGWSVGDKVQLYIKRYGGGGGTSVWAQNFRIRCNILSATVNTD